MVLISVRIITTQIFFEVSLSVCLSVCSQVGHVDSSGRCVLVHAAQHGHLDVLSFLLKRADWSCTSCCGQREASRRQALQQALTAAASMGQSELLSYLLDLPEEDEEEEERPEINTADSLWGETGTMTTVLPVTADESQLQGFILFD